MLATIIICAILLVFLTLAVKSVIKTRKSGGCGCGCSDCPTKCDGAKK